MAAGLRHGLAQALFQLGGNLGQALGPLAASIERLSQSMREIPPAIDAGDRMVASVHASRAPSDSAPPKDDGGGEVHTSALWSWTERGVGDP